MLVFGALCIDYKHLIWRYGIAEAGDHSWYWVEWSVCCTPGLCTMQTFGFECSRNRLTMVSRGVLQVPPRGCTSKLIGLHPWGLPSYCFDTFIKAGQPDYKLADRLYAGQVYNRFATYV